MATNTLALMSGDPDSPTASALNDEALQDFLLKAADMGGDRCALFDLFEQYYEGSHRTELTDRARKYLEPTSQIDFSENFCELIVDEVANRLVVEGFIAQHPEMDDPALIDLGETVSEWWKLARVPQVASVVHTMALMLGEAFAILDWDEEKGRPVVAFNDPRRVRAFYPDDDTTEPIYVSKRWYSTEVGELNPDGRQIERLNIYWPDRIEKFYSLGAGAGTGWEFWTTEEEPWPMPWTGPSGEPLGIPVVHFRNKPLGRSEGRSELKSDIPFQDAHNKLVVDLMMILDNQSWQQRYIIGQAGDSEGVRNVPGEIWKITDPDASVGAFPAESPEGAIVAIENALNRRARRARIPMHLLTGGDMPSGEALRSAEAPLVKKVENRQETLGDSWEAVLRVALMLARVNDGLAFEVPDGVIFQTSWRDPSSEDPKSDLEAAMMKQQLGVSKRTLISELGYDPDQEAEAREEEREQSLGSALMAFDQGGQPEDQATGE